MDQTPMQGIECSRMRGRKEKKMKEDLETLLLLVKSMRK
jgi:hypothetical protein